MILYYVKLEKMEYTIEFILNVVFLSLNFV